jgi:large subunit ribosomal protein L25
MEQKNYNLIAKERSITGKKVKIIRKDGLIPAVMYGHSTRPLSLSVAKAAFIKVFDEAGTSALIDLKIDDKNAVKVLSHEPQINPVSGDPVHVDFYKVRMDEKIRTEIPLEFIGESEAVTQLDGSLVTNRDNVEVECLPADLISQIDVDLSELKTFENSITVADLKVPSSITILTEPEEVIALVEEPRSEEELAELEETSAAEEEAEAIEKMGAEGEAEKAEGGESPSEPTVEAEDTQGKAKE